MSDIHTGNTLCFDEFDVDYTWFGPRDGSSEEPPEDAEVEIDAVRMLLRVPGCDEREIDITDLLTQAERDAFAQDILDEECDQ